MLHFLCSPITPRPSLYTEHNGKGFVDDVSLWETLLTSELREVQEQMQAKAQAWEQGVHVAEGALNLLKTIFFAVSWNFQKNGQPVMRTISKDPNIVINMTQGNDRTHTTPITRVEVTTGHRTLGVRLAPSGDDKMEYQYRLQEAIKLQPRLLRAPLNWESTQIGFTTMILQKFSYPLGATSFTKKECSSIQAKHMPTVLSKMGINRLTPTEVRSGLALCAGMSVSELWPLQGSTKNKLLIGYLQKSDIIGTNLQVELDCLQLQAGVSWDVLSREGTKIRKYVDKCWTSHLWEVNDRYGLTVKREDKHGCSRNANMISSLWKPSQTFQQPPQKDCEEHNAAVISFKLRH
jgi:hypothetical protein